MLLSAAHLLDTTRPLEGVGRWLRVVPFAAIAVAALGVAATASPRYPAAFVVAVALLGLIVGATALPWRRWRAGWQAVPALSYYGIAVLLAYAVGDRVAQSGQLLPVSDFYFLTALPVIWLALFHSRDLMFVGLGLLALVLFVPPTLPDARPGQPWATIVMIFVLSSLGGLAGQQLVSRTRTAATQSTAALRQARADRDLLNAYLDTAGCLVAVLDRAGRVTLFNRFCEEVSGHRAEEVVGGPLWHLAVNPTAIQAAFTGVLSGHSPVRLEDDIVTSDGRRRRISWTVTGLVDDAGEVTYVIATGLDITEQRATERLFADVLAAVTEQMIVAVDTTGRFTVLNAGGERMLGYRADELVGVATVDKIHVPEETEALAAEFGVSSFFELLALAAKQTPTFTREWTLVRKDGTTVPVAMTVSPMRDGETVLGYVSVARDITAEREAAAATAAALRLEREASERLRELDQAKSDFVAVVSHDLRTPLTAIVGNVEMLLDREVGPLTARQQRLLETVDRNSRRLENLVGDLLTLSRIESGTIQLRREVVPMKDVVAGALEALNAQQTDDVRLLVDVPAEPALVRGDPDQLERALINLIGNAFKFTPPGGRVEVAVAADTDHVRLRVSDTGIGIPTQELPHVFDRFFRSAPHEDRPGVGLGLAIVKSIVELHDGAVQVSSEPANGTTFVIELPRLTAPAQTSQRERA